ncbi:MAG: cyclic nucleotide-binding domain-containing protein [Mariprofundaceae bacterium]|nr:cyclic nucleotide-binding domain-containing protein [Mariprofundaceae bacterium]
MDLLSKEYVSGLLKHDWKFLLKLLLSGLFVALGLHELGMKLELSFVAFVFVPLAGLFFTYLKLEAPSNILRLVSIIVVAAAVGLLTKSFFLGLAALLILEGATHRESVVRHDDFKWMRIVKTEDSRENLNRLASGHTLFQTLPEKERQVLSEKCTVMELEPGAALIKQGEFNYHLYLIAKGEVDVVTDGESIASLKEGDVVGEISASGMSMPVADVIAKTRLLAFAFPVDLVNALAMTYPKFAARMHEIGMRRNL